MSSQGDHLSGNLEVLRNLAAVREWKDLVRLSIAHFKFGDNNNNNNDRLTAFDPGQPG